jgi:hypothetical protein
MAIIKNGKEITEKTKYAGSSSALTDLPVDADDMSFVLNPNKQRERQQRQQLSQSELARQQHLSSYRHLVHEDIFHRNRESPKIKETLRFIEKHEQEDPTLIDALLEKEGQ